ncbi:hypothetical protein OG21DRAFT_1499211 [Imleria badia]|nr:hypothetical protein OG21DRAFT_1499211 [Imleria badia]
MGQRPSELSGRHHGESGEVGSRSRSSSTTLEGEQAPPYSPMDSTADQFNEWNGSTNGSETTANSPQNSFVYDGARPAKATRRKTVILFGETGVGKSSVINLMAGDEVALTSSNLEGCTLEAREYSFTLPGPPGEMPFCIYDTVGLNESEIGVNTYFGAIEKAQELVKSLHDAGGIDLLLFCIRGGRITATMQRNYRLFFEFLCEKKVPLALVVTHLEYEDVMESWWERNAETFEEYGIRSNAHACVTAIPPRVSTHAAKREESRGALQKMLRDALSSPKSPYVKEVRSWFFSMADRLWSFLKKGLFASLRRKDLLTRLESRCELSRDEAQRLTDMLMRGG